MGSIKAPMVEEKTNIIVSPEQQKRINIFEKISFYAIFFFALTGGVLFGYILAEVRGSNTINQLAQYRPAVPTILYDVNGKVIAELYKHKQKIVRFSQLPPHLINAFLSVEDQNFYNHFGIDFIAILRAAAINAINLRIVQGGSTLTQQVAKVVTEKTQKTFIRKFYEAILALQIEKEFSKREILEMYFNIIYLGHGTRGVGAASRLYFEKDVAELSLAESAVLARLPKAPVSYSPFKYPHKAKRIHKTVLRLMVENGFISSRKAKNDYEIFWEEYWPKIVMRSPSQTTFGRKKDLAPYFTDYVRELLKRNVAIGEEKVYSAGLKVYTTLDLDMQKIAKEEILKQLVKSDKIAQYQARYYVKGADPEIVSAYNILNMFLRLPQIDKKAASYDQKYVDFFKKNYLKELEVLNLFTGSNNAQSSLLEFDIATQIFKENLHVQAAFIVIDYHNGYIQTMIGGREYSPKNQFNRAMLARRQPGSAFKPFVYGALLNSGIVHSANTMLNTPTVELGDDGISWAVENYSGDFSGRVTLEYALYQSLNIVAVRAYNKIGPEPIIDYALKMMRLKDPGRFAPAPTLALGSSEVTPLEMATAYSIYANRGKEVIPFAIRYVTDSQGNIILNRELEIQNTLAIKEKNGDLQVIGEDIAWIMEQLMVKVTRIGTGYHGIRHEAKFKGDVAGKTGTTSGWYDAWFSGYTPEFAAVLWMGLDRRTVSLGRHQGGGSLAGPLWGQIIKRIYQKKKIGRFDRKKPKNVFVTNVCKYTGLAPKVGVCKKLSQGYFVRRPKRKLEKYAICDGEHKQSIKFEDYLQKQFEIENEEINKKKGGFKD